MSSGAWSAGDVTLGDISEATNASSVPDVSLSSVPVPVPSPVTQPSDLSVGTTQSAQQVSSASTWRPPADAGISVSVLSLAASDDESAAHTVGTGGGKVGGDESLLFADHPAALSTSPSPQSQPPLPHSTTSPAAPQPHVAAPARTTLVPEHLRVFLKPEFEWRGIRVSTAHRPRVLSPGAPVGLNPIAAAPIPSDSSLFGRASSTHSRISNKGASSSGVGSSLHSTADPFVLMARKQHNPNASLPLVTGLMWDDSTAHSSLDDVNVHRTPWRSPSVQVPSSLDAMQLLQSVLSQGSEQPSVHTAPTSAEAPATTQPASDYIPSKSFLSATDLSNVSVRTVHGSDRERSFESFRDHSQHSHGPQWPPLAGRSAIMRQSRREGDSSSSMYPANDSSVKIDSSVGYSSSTDVAHATSEWTSNMQSQLESVERQLGSLLVNPRRADSSDRSVRMPSSPQLLTPAVLGISDSHVESKEAVQVSSPLRSLPLLPPKTQPQVAARSPPPPPTGVVVLGHDHHTHWVCSSPGAESCKYCKLEERFRARMKDSPMTRGSTSLSLLHTVVPVGMQPTPPLDDELPVSQQWSFPVCHAKGRCARARCNGHQDYVQRMKDDLRLRMRRANHRWRFLLRHVSRQDRLFVMRMMEQQSEKGPFDRLHPPKSVNGFMTTLRNLDRASFRLKPEILYIDSELFPPHPDVGKRAAPLRGRRFRSF